MYTITSYNKAYKRKGVVIGTTPYVRIVNRRIKLNLSISNTRIIVEDEKVTVITSHGYIAYRLPLADCTIETK